MAIQISQTEKTPSWVNILFYFSLVLLLVAVSSYFILDSLQKKTDTTIKELDSQLVVKKTQAEINLENYEKKINDFSRLINGYIYNSGFFNFIEKDTHPNVWFTKIDVTSAEKKVQLKGIADSFQTIGQQLIIFKKDNLIQKVELSDIAFGKGGEIGFNFNLILDPKVFQK